MPELETIAPAALHELSRTTRVRLIDVRTPREFHRGHARGAENIPTRRLDPAVLSPSQPVYLICRGGSRSAEAAERLHPEVRAVVVEGGTLAWEAAGLPVDRPTDWKRYGKRVQRVGAALIVGSILLSAFVHRGLLGLAAFVGAALILNQMIVNHLIRRADAAFEE
jgi:rhodanese-related sulfurtransferase